MGQFNRNKESTRHRCADCGRVRKASKMRPLNKKSGNKRDAQWQCKNCKEGIRLKKSDEVTCN